MEKPKLLHNIEQALGYTFGKLLDIHKYFNDPEIYPDSYRAVMSWQQEMLRDGHGGTAFINSEGRLLGLNFYAESLDSEGIQRLLALDLPDLLALNLNQTGVDRFIFTARQPQLMYVNLSQNEALTEVRFRYCPAQLRILDVYDCRVQALDLPAGLEALEKIDAARNESLARLSFGGPFPQLWFLELSENQLMELEFPAGFPALQYLFLRKNKLERLSFGGKMEGLDSLDLRENKLEALPELLVHSEKLQGLYLHGNPLTTLPTELISSDERGNSAEAMMAYLRESEKGTITNYRAKMILVGNGRAGKTSLYRRLKDEPFNEQEPYTHGIKLEALGKQNIPSVKTEELQLSVWDFGGQEIFYATHQFFLSEEALYVLVWTDYENVRAHRERNREDLGFEDVWRPEEYWLENIRLHGKNSPLLMVQTHTDRRELNDPAISQNFGAECLKFSAKRDYGLLKLKDRIGERLGELPFLGQAFPRTYSQVIEAIEALRSGKADAGRVSLSLKEFFEIAEVAGIDRGGEMELLSYLNKAGIVVYLGAQPAPSLENIIFIDPNWLTEQVYRLINPELARMNGEISSAWMYQVFPEDTPLQQQQLLDLLRTFELVFQDSETPDLYIAPQYLPENPDRNAQRIIESVKPDLALVFVFRFPRFVPENVMINFLSRYGPYSNKVYWKHGIYFRSNQGVNGLVTFQDSALSVSVSDGPSRPDAAREICKAFADLSRNANAEVSIDGQRFVSWQELVKEATLKNTFVMDTEGQPIERGPFTFLVTAAVEPDPESSNQTPKGPLRAFVSYAHGEEPIFMQAFVKGCQAQSMGDWATFDDRQIPLGADWDKTLRAQMGTCNFGILLLSPLFFQSKYIEQVEMSRFLERSRDEGFLIFPVLLIDCDFTRWAEVAKRQLFLPPRRDFGFNDDQKDQPAPFDHLFRHPEGARQSFINSYCKAFVAKVTTALKTP